MKVREDTAEEQNKLIYTAMPDLKTIIFHFCCLCRRGACFVFLKDIFIISDETHLSLNKDFPLCQIRWCCDVASEGMWKHVWKGDDKSPSLPLMYFKVQILF